MTTLRVKAIQPGYYGSVRRDPGDQKNGQFVLVKASDFSANWMETVGWDVEAEQAKEKAEAAEPKLKAVAPKPAVAPAAPTPIKASTETTVMPPATAPKQVSPITGQDI